MSEININDFLAVYPDASFKVYVTKEQAIVSKPLFVASTIESAFPIPSDASRKKYGFRIVDTNDRTYNINCDGWQIISIIKYYYHYSRTKLKIVAPDGEVKEIDTDDGVTLESVAKLLPFINEFRGYKDWSYYELKQENLKLINENLELKGELARKGENEL